MRRASKDRVKSGEKKCSRVCRQKYPTAEGEDFWAIGCVPVDWGWCDVLLTKVIPELVQEFMY